MRSSKSRNCQQSSSAAHEFVRDTLHRAGISIGGSAPGDIEVHDGRFYDRVVAQGTLGLGESYVDGWWDAAQLDVFFAKCLGAGLQSTVKSRNHVLMFLQAKLLNMQTRSRARRVAEKHYNLGNAFYSDMLGPGMHYTCAYWHGVSTLEQAQNAKCELICKKLMLEPGDSLLELGCGWGGFAEYAARHYGCRVTAYNIAEEQVRYARERCKDLDVEIVHSDYRGAKGTYDKVVTIGMFEHVGPKNYRMAMGLAENCLKDDGLFLLHTIGVDEPRTTLDPWFEKYIFPGGALPSIQRIAQAAEGQFVVEHFHGFGPYYGRTLMAWHENFRGNWHKYEHEYGQRFFRMWSYYLLSCAGAFRARRNQLWQWVFSKHGVPGGYKAPLWTWDRREIPVFEREYEFADSQD